jgi:hypothetical protein
LTQPSVSNWEVAAKSALRSLVPIVITLLTQYEQGKFTTASALISAALGAIAKLIFSGLTAKSVNVKGA